MSSSLLERLQDSPYTVVVRDRRLELRSQTGAEQMSVEPEIESAFTALAPDLYRNGAKLRRHLEVVRGRLVNDHAAAKRLYTRLSKEEWPADPRLASGFSSLLGWATACQKIAEADNAFAKLGTRRPGPEASWQELMRLAPVLGGRWADGGAYTRLLPPLEEVIVSTAILWQEFNEKVTAL